MVTAILVTAICLVLAFPVAYAYARTSFGPKGLLLIAILSPFYIDILVRIYAWMVLLGRNGLIDQALLALGLLQIAGRFPRGLPGHCDHPGVRDPAVHDPVADRSAPEHRRDVVQAAQVCGATPARVFRSVILPLSIPGVVAGSILSFSVGISAFVVPLLVGGKIGQQFLAVVVYSSMNTFQDWGLGARRRRPSCWSRSLGIVLLYNWLMRVTPHRGGAG